MRNLKILARLHPALLWAAVLTCHITYLCSGIAAQDTGNVSQDTAKDKTAQQAQVAFTHDLPHMDGNRLKVTIVEVTYGPGESSPPHSHPCPVIGYVIEGSLRTQVKGEPVTVYRTGQSFYEAPNGIHQISANASAKRPVKFLAYFVCDHETPLSVAPLDSAGAK